MARSEHWNQRLKMKKTLRSAVKAGALPLEAIEFLMNDIKNMEN